MRPIEKYWVVKIQGECSKYNDPLFFKQWGKTRDNQNPNDPTINNAHRYHTKGGCELDRKYFGQLQVYQIIGYLTINLFGDEYLVMGIRKEN